MVSEMMERNKESVVDLSQEHHWCLGEWYSHVIESESCQGRRATRMDELESIIEKPKICVIHEDGVLDAVEVHCELSGGTAGCAYQ